MHYVAAHRGVRYGFEALVQTRIDADVKEKATAVRILLTRTANKRMLLPKPVSNSHQVQF